ncbi:hypothetical protein [Clostridium sp. CM027]|nr:hypothetical protein [Clostridium sp. CM027]
MKVDLSRHFSKEQKDAFRKMDITNPIVEDGYIGIDTQKDNIY